MIATCATAGSLWLLATVAAIALGLLFYVKALLVAARLVFLALAYFTEGGPVARLRQLVRRYWPAAIGLGVVVGGYVAYYTTHVNEPFVRSSPGLIGRLADSMISTAFGSALIGGPWSWESTRRPTRSPTRRPGRSTWPGCVIVAGGAVRRPDAGCARSAPGSCSRATWSPCSLCSPTAGHPSYGPISGREYRYLTEAPARSRSASGSRSCRCAARSSRARRDPSRCSGSGCHPRLVGRAGPCGLRLVGRQHACRTSHRWHTDNASRRLPQHPRARPASHGAVDLADQPVPDDVIPGVVRP